ncbi:uncharacterized protein [Amphiura filiformis]|uniref:uncharacterized protein n=1 Tax=Amphiura filiformis TaxID=82378 RepID=UPI003B20BE14
MPSELPDVTMPSELPENNGMKQEETSETVACNPNSTEVWIIGDDHVLRMEKVAKLKPGGYNLGLDQFGISVTFRGRPGAGLSDLGNLIEEGMQESSYYPDIIVIHLGMNDFNVMSHGSMYHMSFELVEVCKSMLPQTSVIFSGMLPCQFYRNFDDQSTAERVRKHMDKSHAKVWRSAGWEFIKHRYISSTDIELYVDCLYLSDAGYGLMMVAYANMITQIYTDVKNKDRFKKQQVQSTEDSLPQEVAMTHDEDSNPGQVEGQPEEISKQKEAQNTEDSKHQDIAKDAGKNLAQPEETKQHQQGQTTEDSNPQDVTLNQDEGMSLRQAETQPEEPSQQVKNPGADSANLTKVWIIGDSHVIHAKQVAQSRPGGCNLELDHLGISVTFMGRPEASLDDLGDMINEEMKRSCYPPDIVLIHLGIYDLCDGNRNNTRYSITGKVQGAVEVCKRMLPKTKVIYSEILARRFYFKWHVQRIADKLRRQVNKVFAKLMEQEGCQIVLHAYIERHSKDLFHIDCFHLNDKGYGLVLDSFANAIKKAHTDDDIAATKNESGVEAEHCKTNSQPNKFSLKRILLPKK